MPTTTFMKRQKEMKRQEKQREKAERRAQRKIARQAQGNQNEGAQLEQPVAEDDQMPRSGI